MRGYLYTWNPNNWPWEELPLAAKMASRAAPYKTDWSCGNTKKISMGDLVFMIRLGVEPKGLLGFGYTTSTPKHAPHWDLEKAAKGQKQLRTNVEFVVLDEEPIVSLERLESHFPIVNWTPQSSGVSIPEEITLELLDLVEANFTRGDEVRDHRLARIAYNSVGWERPTGDAARQESGDTYNAQNKFGHEDWLFREKWQIDGWRYAFIEGFNTKNQTYAGKSLDVSLYTIQPDKKCRLVGTINQVEGLNEEQAKAAVETFKAKGWYSMMKDEIRAIGGNAEALDRTDWAPHILNVRFKVDNVDLYPEDTFLEETQWLKDRHRYMLYKFDRSEQDAQQKAISRRKGSHEAPQVKKLFRKGTKPVEFTPEHQKIQAKLVDELRSKYPAKCVICEQDYVDVRIETDKEVIYYEIKTDLDTRTVIRQAIGQLLEYAYYPGRSGRQPDQLVVVGRGQLDATSERYLQLLENEFNLPICYKRIIL